MCNKVSQQKGFWPIHTSRNNPCALLWEGLRQAWHPWASPGNFPDRETYLSSVEFRVSSSRESLKVLLSARNETLKPDGQWWHSKERHTSTTREEISRWFGKRIWIEAQSIYFLHFEVSHAWRLKISQVAWMLRLEDRFLYIPASSMLVYPPVPFVVLSLESLCNFFYLSLTTYINQII